MKCRIIRYHYLSRHQRFRAILFGYVVAQTDAWQQRMEKGLDEFTKTKSARNTDSLVVLE